MFDFDKLLCLVTNGRDTYRPCDKCGNKTRTVRCFKCQQDYGPVDESSKLKAKLQFAGDLQLSLDDWVQKSVTLMVTTHVFLHFGSVIDPQYTGLIDAVKKCIRWAPETTETFAALGQFATESNEKLAA